MPQDEKYYKYIEEIKRLKDDLTGLSKLSEEIDGILAAILADISRSEKVVELEAEIRTLYVAMKADIKPLKPKDPPPISGGTQSKEKKEKQAQLERPYIKAAKETLQPGSAEKRNKRRLLLDELIKEKKEIEEKIKSSNSASNLEELNSEREGAMKSKENIDVRKNEIIHDISTFEAALAKLVWDLNVEGREWDIDDDGVVTEEAILLELKEKEQEPIEPIIFNKIHTHKATNNLALKRSKEAPSDGGTSSDDDSIGPESKGSPKTASTPTLTQTNPTKTDPSIDKYKK